MKSKVIAVLFILTIVFFAFFACYQFGYESGARDGIDAGRTEQISAALPVLRAAQKALAQGKVACE